MANVDERIIKMAFDNKEFLIEIAKSIAAIKGLDASIDNTSQKSGALQKLKDSLSNFNMDGAKNAVDGVGQRFSALSVMAIGALASIGAKSVEVGSQLLKNLSIRPVLDGFNEYQLQIKSVQTILANTKSKGEDINSVNAALDELNTYADKTVYNFSEMTANIGRFTAAGVGLKDSVNAIKGISNMAAMSGSTTQQASSAMYQLSQAIASGTVKLMDWNSVVNAGMGGEQFQEALKRTARAHGVAVDDMIKKQGSFRDSLQEGWLKADIMNETLAQIAGAFSDADLAAKGYSEDQIQAIQEMARTAEDAATHVKTFDQLFQSVNESLGSSWAITWRMIIGDYSEAEDLFTRLNAAITGVTDQMANNRYKLMKEWHDLGGRDKLIEGLANVMKGLWSVIEQVRQAWTNVFPPMTAQRLYDLTAKFESFTEKLKMSDETADKVRRTFEGLFSIFHIIVTAADILVKAFFSLIGAVSPATGGVLDFLAACGDKLDQLDDFLTNTGRLQEAMAKIGHVLGLPLVGLKKFGEAVKNAFVDVDWSSIGAFFESIGQKFQPLIRWFDTLDDKFAKLKEKVRGLLGNLEDLKKLLSDIAGKIKDKLNAAWQNFGLDDLAATFGGITTGGLLLGIVQVIKIIKELKSENSILDEAKTVAGKFGEVMDTLKQSIQSFIVNLNIKSVLTISIAIGILAASMFLLSAIDGQKLAESAGIVTGVLFELIGSMIALNRLLKVNAFTGFSGLVGYMIGLSIAVGILAISVKALGEMSWSELVKGLGSVILLVGSLTASLKIISSNERQYTKGAIILQSMAISVGILAISVKKLGELSWTELAKGMASVTLLLGELVGALEIISSRTEKYTQGVLILLTLSATVSILANVVKSLGELSWTELAKGLSVVTILLGELVGALEIVSSQRERYVKGALVLMSLAISVNILSAAVKSLANMSWTEMAKGLAATTILLGELVAATKVMGDSHSMMGAATMVIMAAALDMLVDPLKALGQMSMKEIGKSLLEMGGAIGILAAAIMIMGAPTAIIGGVALIAAAKGLEMLVDPLKALGQMSMKEIGKSLLELFGALLLLAAAVTAMGQPLALIGCSALVIAAAGLNILADPLKKLGQMSMKEIGKSLLELAGVFVVLAAGGILLIPASVGFLLFASSLLMIGGAIKMAGEGAKGFAELISVIAISGAAAVAFFDDAVHAFVQNAIAIGTAFGDILVGIAQSISDNAPKITQCFWDLLTALVTQAHDNLPHIVETFLQTCLDVLDILIQYAPQIGDKGAEFVLRMIDGANQHVGEFVGKATELAVNFIGKLGEHVNELVNAGAVMVLNVLNGIDQAIVNHAEGFRQAGANIAYDLVDGLTGGILSKISDGGIDRAMTTAGNSAVQSMRKAVDSHSPSKKFIKIGKDVMAGFIIGTNEGAREIPGSYSDAGNMALDSMRNALKTAGEIAMDDFDISPVITPVVDMSDIENSARLANSLLGFNDAISGGHNTARYANTVVDPNVSAMLPGDVAPKVEFNQTINSPKPLSRYDIYRDTKNLVKQIRSVR